MTLDELIDRLTELREDYDLPGDTPIKGAFQPNYPLTTEIQAITTILSADAAAVVYVAVGDGDEYGSRRLWDDEVIEDEDEDEEDAD